MYFLASSWGMWVGGVSISPNRRFLSRLQSLKSIRQRSKSLLVVARFRIILLCFSFPFTSESMDGEEKKANMNRFLLL